MNGVSALDQMPGQVNILMLKKAMEVQKDVGAMVVEMMSQVAPPPLNPPHLGQLIDVTM